MTVDRSEIANVTRRRKRSRLEARISAEEKELLNRLRIYKGAR